MRPVRPVRTSSTISCPSSSLRNASHLVVVPVSSIITESLETSTIFALKISATEIISFLSDGFAFNLDKNELSAYRLARLKLHYIHYILKLVELFLDLDKAGFIAANCNSHSGISGILSFSYCHTVNVITSSTEQS